MCASKTDLELYIHIPFCIKKCNYCDFLSFPSNEERREIYVQSLINEIEQTGKLLDKDAYAVRSIFIGGGTPSLLSAVNAGIRSALGSLFTWKFSILLAVVVLSVIFYRPFCKWLCPLGAFYALLNKVSLFQMKVDQNKCVSCGKCARACKMDVDVTKSPNHTECIRCGMCIRACPTDAIRFRYGFGEGKDTQKTEKAVPAPQNNTQ